MSTENSANTESYGAHIEALKSGYTEALSNCDARGEDPSAVLIHSGTEQHYYADDRGVPFQAFGHLLHWIPVNRPNQFIYYRPGGTPIYFQVVPSDFWYEQDIESQVTWADHLNIVRFSSLDELANELSKLSVSDTAYLGEHPEIAKFLGIDEALVNPRTLLAELDFARAIKSEYEVAQLRSANRLALLGHSAAKSCFLEGGTEFEIHMAFLQATQTLEDESPYTNIVALNEKAAILHYQFKRKSNPSEGKVLLIDAGCRVQCYGSDITRTSVRDDVHPLFRSLLGSMEELELALVDQVQANTSYQSLQASALAGIAKILSNHEICTGSQESLISQNIPQLFMPHGVGHLLGIQVHDVGGHQADKSGTVLAPPEESPALRNTRIMQSDMVFTIEPGLYFIPLLLEAERRTDRGKQINWKLVDELYPCGGIRIEDNIRVTEGAAENLTRQFE